MTGEQLAKVMHKQHTEIRKAMPTSWELGIDIEEKAAYVTSEIANAYAMTVGKGGA